MSTLAQTRMTVDEFLVWAEGREGRWELYNGVPYTTSPDTVGHGEVRMAVYIALLRAAGTATQPCYVVGSGVGIRASESVMYVPDALVYCGQELPDDAIEVPNPVILVEVTSPPTRQMDEAVKPDDYFRLPSVHHYLMVDPEGPPVIHHSREADGTILKSEVYEGILTLSPAGIEVGMAELFAAEA
jgi:Uma2 family endonuclease